MPVEIGRDEVRGLVDAGGQIVDVMPHAEFADSHLPGAVNIPLKELDAERARALRRDAPIIVYCYDYQ